MDSIAAIVVAGGTAIASILAVIGTRSGNKKAEEQKAAALQIEQERQELVDARAISADRLEEIKRLQVALSEARDEARRLDDDRRGERRDNDDEMRTQRRRLVWSENYNAVLIRGYLEHGLEVPDPMIPIPPTRTD